MKTIERWNAAARDFAETGESIGITLANQMFIERGAIAASESALPYALTGFKARVFWLGKQPFQQGKRYLLKLATQEAECQLERLDRVLNAATLETVKRDAADNFLARHEVGDLTLKMKRPIAFDSASEVAATGRFVIVDGFDIAGGGIILSDNYPRRTADSLHKSQDIFWTSSKVTATQRSRHNGHAGCVVWLTGLSCSGKTTIAADLERELFQMGRQVYVLDGDNIRHGLCADLAFSPEDRRENIRRIGEVAKLFADAGMICITAFISPYRADRHMVRQSLPAGQFIEVYLSAPVEVCEQRDSKGLYAKARAGTIRDFTGVNAPYEPPLAAELELQTAQLAVADSVASIIDYLNTRHWLTPNPR